MNEAEKQAYTDKVEARLEKWQAEIDRLAAKAKEASADARMDYHREIKELRERREAVKMQLSELKSCGSQAWEDVRSGVEQAWGDLESSVHRASSRMG